MIKTFNEIYDEFEKSNYDDFVVMYFNDEEVTYSKFKKRVKEIMKHLVAFGVKEGTGVGYTLLNSTDIIPLFVAISRLGAYALPIFTGIPAVSRMKSFKSAAVSFVITNASGLEDLKKSGESIGYSPEFIIVENSEEYKSIFKGFDYVDDVLEYAVDIHKSDIPLMLGSSSGTTGIPKEVIMTQGNVGSEMIVSMEMFKVRKFDGEHAIESIAFPFSTTVMLVLCGIMFAKSSLVFSEDVRPVKFLKDIERRKSTGVTAPPAYFESLLLLKDSIDFDLMSVTTYGAGMDFSSPSLLKRLQKGLFKNLKYFYSGYGLVETCNVYMYTTYDISGEIKDDIADFNLAEDADNIIEVRDENGKVVQCGEVGEIYVKGPNVVNGYKNSKEEEAQAFKDGWLKTGDIALKISDTKVRLMGRRKYFIKRNGKSVSPIVVQTEINKTEGIVDSGVVGVPHPLYGEMIWAFVVKDKNSKAGLGDIKKQCKKVLPYYMLPDQVTFIDAIPKGAGVGKVDFETLKKMAKEQLELLGVN